VTVSLVPTSVIQDYSLRRDERLQQCDIISLSIDLPPKLFATKRRIRFGVGRHSYQWCLDVLAMTDKGRDTLEGGVNVESRMIDVRIKAFF
jgi:hypothetical protein